MSNKKDFKNILSTFTGVGENPQQEESKQMINKENDNIVTEQGTTQEELELLNSIEDEELKRALIARRNIGRGRPRKNDINGKRSDGYSRYTLIASVEKMAKIKEIAFQNTLTQKEVFDEAITMLIKKYEAIHGEVIPHPENYTYENKRLFED